MTPPVAPLLTIVRDPAQASMYEHLSKEAGLGVIHSEGALHALTQLERSPVSAIICDAQMDDMSGEEFREVVQDEAKTKDVPVFILPDPERPAGDSVAAPCGPELLADLFTLLGINSARFPVPVSATAQPQLQGVLGEFSLADFLNWVAEMRFDGHWLVSVPTGAGQKRTAHLAMVDGNVTYAEYMGLGGKEALLSLLRSLQEQPHSDFWFYKIPTAHLMRSADLTKSTARLLMELAVDIDHMQIKRAVQNAH